MDLWSVASKGSLIKSLNLKFVSSFLQYLWNNTAENTMTDSKYFTTTKKGEIFELKSELNNDKKEKKKEAVKKVGPWTLNELEKIIDNPVIRATLGHCEHDGGQGRFGAVPRRGQLHADGQSGAEETRLPVFDELRQIAARYGYYGRQYVR